MTLPNHQKSKAEAQRFPRPLAQLAERFRRADRSGSRHFRTIEIAPTADIPVPDSPCLRGSHNIRGLDSINRSKRFHLSDNSSLNRNAVVCWRPSRKLRTLRISADTSRCAWLIVCEWIIYGKGKSNFNGTVKHCCV